MDSYKKELSRYLYNYNYFVGGRTDIDVYPDFNTSQLDDL